MPTFILYSPKGAPVQAPTLPGPGRWANPAGARQLFNCSPPPLLLEQVLKHTPDPTLPGEIFKQTALLLLSVHIDQLSRTTDPPHSSALPCPACLSNLGCGPVGPEARSRLLLRCRPTCHGSGPSPPGTAHPWPFQWGPPAGPPEPRRSSSTTHRSVHTPYQRPALLSRIPTSSRGTFKSGVQSSSISVSPVPDKRWPKGSWRDIHSKRPYCS